MNSHVDQYLDIVPIGHLMTWRGNGPGTYENNIGFYVRDALLGVFNATDPASVINKGPQDLKDIPEEHQKDLILLGALQRIQSPNWRKGSARKEKIDKKHTKTAILSLAQKEEITAYLEAKKEERVEEFMTQIRQRIEAALVATASKVKKAKRDENDPKKRSEWTCFSDKETREAIAACTFWHYVNEKGAGGFLSRHGLMVGVLTPGLTAIVLIGSELSELMGGPDPVEWAYDKVMSVKNGPPKKVWAYDLVEAYTKNPIQATNQQPIEGLHILGEVTEINNRVRGSIVLSLEAGDKGKDVWAYFSLPTQAELNGVSIGNVVEVACESSSFNSTDQRLATHDCTLIP